MHLKGGHRRKLHLGAPAPPQAHLSVTGVPGSTALLTSRAGRAYKPLVERDMKRRDEEIEKQCWEGPAQQVAFGKQPCHRLPDIAAAGCSALRVTRRNSNGRSFKTVKRITFSKK
jgi:hypothetical protein